MMNDESEDGPPAALLGVLSPQGNIASRGAPAVLPRRESIPADDREHLIRTAAEILQEFGGQVDAGQLIVLAGWLGGMD